MKELSVIRNQAGFTLVHAIFILVVLAALGAYMVTLSGVQSRTPVMVLQGVRAYHAARSGLEWGIAQADAGAVCSGSMTIENFNVTVGCTSAVFTEATTTTTVYRISALAESGSYGSPTYVSRRLEMKMAL